MGVFQGYDANLPTQLWIAARYLQSLSFFFAPLFFQRTLKPRLAFIGFAMVLVLVLASIFYWHNFPVCYVEGVGLTSFKKVSEYIICLLLLVAIAVLYRSQRFDQSVVRYFLLSITALIGAELAFATYISIYGIINFTGHLLKTISFIFLYRAIIVIGLKQPYDLLFRDLKQSEMKLKRARDGLELRVQHRTVELEQANHNLIQAYNETLEGWSRALELRDKATIGHTQRVMEMSLRLADRLEMSEQELAHVRRGALLHDIGKMGIPDSILLKTDSLSKEELAIMRKHAEYAFDMLSSIDYLRPALAIPYCHHEKWDGTSYPLGLKGESIPLAARLFAVVDVWDALRSDRPYSKAWGETKVHEYLRSQAGRHFEPRIVEHFLSIVTDKLYYLNSN